MPREISPELLAHFALDETSTCYLLAIIPRQGATEGFTSLNRDLVSNGITYRASSGATPSSVPGRMKLPTMSVDAQVMFSAGQFDRGRVLRHYYDGARFLLSTVNYAGDLDDVADLMAGVVGQANLDDYGATLELESWAALLERPFGRQTSPTCGCTVPGEGRCRNLVLEDGWRAEDYTDAGCVVIAVVSASEFTISGITDFTNLSGWRDGPQYLGRLRAMSGANFDIDAGAGYVEVVKEYDPDTGALKLRVPLPFVPEIGDVFDAIRGCNRLLETCVQQPNRKGSGGSDLGTGNTDNFRGEPYVLLDKAGAKQTP